MVWWPSSTENGPRSAGEQMPGSKSDVEDFLDAGGELESGDGPTGGKFNDADAAAKLVRVFRR